ncbi:hypothetical protein [Nocardioides rubriscoriae]|uniref:hypothetical protein n=1 Tax=Nocardioides rubriscoriae TaxID=642762 RepID=UPI0011DF6840|nr:hypothetical protein [Nocardioides rubriscoriae]
MSEHDPEAGPAEQEAVRRLLAEARHVEPLPPDVAARLDGVLAQLAAEGPHAVDPAPAAPHAAQVVDLAARRRRRARGLLGAAAAVVVLGVGATQVLDSTSRSGSDDSASSTAEAGADSSVADAQAPAKQEDAPADAGGQGGPTALSSTLPPTTPRIDRAGFRASVLRLRDAAAVASPGARTRLGAAGLTADRLFVCPPTTLGPGRLVPVVYAGAPAVLVYRPATGATQSVELLQCGTAAVLRSVVLPAR